MPEQMIVTVASADPKGLARVQSMLDGQADMHVECRLFGNNGHTDPLYEIRKQPDLLVLILGPAWQTELETLGTEASIELPPFIVMAPEDDVRIMRLAMRTGASDFLDASADRGELLRCVREIAHERRVGHGTKSSVTAFINSKGGSGASLVASSLAHVLAQTWHRRVALLDLDLQFGCQDLCLDLKPKGSLLEAIRLADQLDAAALEGFMSKHPSGVHLLGAYTEALPLPWEVPTAKLACLLRVAAGGYDHVVVDLPRQIDPLTTTVFQNADHICVVMNQSVIHLRDTRQILGMLTRELRAQAAQIQVVVNRYQSDAAVSLRDIKAALNGHPLVRIPSDPQRAHDATNLGLPIYAGSPNAPISRALVDLGAVIEGTPPKRSKGLRGTLANWIAQ